MNVSSVNLSSSEKVHNSHKCNDLRQVKLWYMNSVSAAVVNQNAAGRVRDRIRKRLSELGMTQREFAKRLHHLDGWASGLLGEHPRFDIALNDLDEVAEAIKLTPGDLVRSDEDAWDLRPSEKRLVRAVRELPPPIRDHLIILAEYLVGVSAANMPLMRKIDELMPDERRRIEHWVDVTLQSPAHERAVEAPRDPRQAGAASTATSRRMRRSR